MTRDDRIKLVKALIKSLLEETYHADTIGEAVAIVLIAMDELKSA